MNMSTVKSSTIKEFSVDTNVCTATVRMHMYDEITDKIVIMFPSNGPHKKIVVLKPSELTLLAELADSINSHITIDPIVYKIEQNILPMIKDFKMKIPAIKEFRNITGVGLKDAKDEIEYIMDFGFDLWKKNRRRYINERCIER